MASKGNKDQHKTLNSFITTTGEGMLVMSDKIKGKGKLDMLPYVVFLVFD